MDATDPDVALGTLDKLIGLAKHEQTKADLQEVRALVCRQQQALLAQTAGLREIDKALDAASARKKALLDRIRAAIQSGPHVVTEFDTLQDAAQWCEAVAGVAQDARAVA